MLKALIPFLLLALTACHKDKNEITVPQSPDENELITTLKLVYTDSAMGDTQTAIFRDIDGPGGNPPTQFDTIRLKTQTVYLAQIILLDESSAPIDTISNEVYEKRNEHQFFFTSTDAAITTSYGDFDDNGVPLGLKLQMKTGMPTTGTASTFTISLKHQGDQKPVSGTGNSSAGSTDIQIAFPLLIK